jgi:hypothetical protein
VYSMILYGDEIGAPWGKMSRRRRLYSKQKAMNGRLARHTRLISRTTFRNNNKSLMTAIEGRDRCLFFPSWVRGLRGIRG